MSKTTDKKPFSAIQMRVVLAILLFVTLVGLVAGFYVAYTSLREVAQDVSRTQTNAKLADTKLQHLVNLESQLKQYSPTIAKAQQIVAESQSYQYQNQILEDMKLVAQQVNLGIASVTFQENTNGGATANTTPNTDTNSATQQGASGSESSTSNAPAATAIKSTSILLQLSGNPTYEQLLHFVYLIEQNVTRMQIAELSLSGGNKSDDGSGNAPTLNIEVYIR